MFGKLKGIFKKEQMVLDVKFDQTDVFLENELRNDISYTKEKIYPQIDLIINEFQALRKIIDDMSGKKSNNLYADSVKNRFCLRSMDVVDYISKPDFKYEKIKKFIFDVENILGDINNINIKEFRHLHEFRDDMAAVSSKTRTIGEKLEKLKKEDLSPLGKIHDINTGTEKIRNFISLKKGISREIEAETKKIDMLEGQLQEKKNDMQNILNSKEMTEIEKINYEIRDIEKKMKSIEQRIATEFGIGRLLKKFIHSMEIKNHTADLVEKYIENPVEAFLKDSEYGIKKIIESILESIERNYLIVDEKELEKILDILRRFDVLKSMKNNYFELEMSMNENMSSLGYYGKYVDKKNHLKKEIEMTEKELIKTRSKKIEKFEELNSINIDNELKSLENSVGTATGKTVKIIL